MIREANHPGAELDVLGALGGGGDEHLRGGDRLPPGAVVLSYPGFVEAQVVDPLQQLHVSLEAERRVFSEPVEGGQEHTELQSVRKGHPVWDLT